MFITFPNSNPRLLESDKTKFTGTLGMDCVYKAYNLYNGLSFQ